MERTNFYDAIYSPVVLALNAVVAGIVMLLSASGNAMVLTFFGMSVGTSVAIINYISRIFAPIESLGMEIQTIQSAMAGVKRIDAFLAQPERTIPAERRTAARGDVELAHVTFGYGEKPVLSDFSMTVKKGGQVTLVGRTGAGKSTVFKLLLGLYQPQAGTVTIGGVDVLSAAAVWRMPSLTFEILASFSGSANSSFLSLADSLPAVCAFAFAAPVPACAMVSACTGCRSVCCTVSSTALCFVAANSFSR